MSQFLIGKGVEISVDDVLYVGDADGVVNLPSEHDERMVNAHGLTKYVTAPEAPEATKASAKADKKAKE